MITSATTRKTGEQGGQIVFDAKFRKYKGGLLTDADDYLTGGLPTVKIYNPQGQVVKDSSLMGQLSAVRISTGLYNYVYVSNLTDETSALWKIEWSILISGSTFVTTETFTIAHAGTVEYTQAEEEEFRVGFAFNNPDLTSDHHGKLNINGEVKGFGKIITPDELRGMVGFGVKLVSPDAAQTYDDNMLQWFIDVALASLEQDLSIDLVPRVVRHVDPVDDGPLDLESSNPLVGTGTDARTEGGFVPREDLPSEEDEPNRIREDPYPYRPNPSSYYNYVRLRRRPLIDVLKVIYTDPQQNAMVNLYNWRKEQKGFDSSVQFFPPIQAIQSLYLMASTDQYLNQVTHGNDYPSALWVDYRTGFQNAADVPKDFRGVLLWLAGVLLLDDLGDARSPGLASGAVSLNSISESFSTTQSASIIGDCYVTLRNKETGFFLNKPIEKIFQLYEQNKIHTYNYEVRAVNPQDITDVKYKQLLGIEQHHIPKKKCFKVNILGSSSIGITEDHSLFELDNEKLKEIKGSDLKVGTEVACISGNYIFKNKVTRIIPIQPKDDVVYDLSVADFENFVVNGEILAHNTNALYGARRANYLKNVKEWLKANKNKYQRTMIGIL